MLKYNQVNVKHAQLSMLNVLEGLRLVLNLDIGEAVASLKILFNASILKHVKEHQHLIILLKVIVMINTKEYCVAYAKMDIKEIAYLNAMNVLNFIWEF